MHNISSPFTSNDAYIQSQGQWYFKTVIYRGVNAWSVFRCLLHYISFIKNLWKKYKEKTFCFVVLWALYNNNQFALSNQLIDIGWNQNSSILVRSELFDFV